MSAAAVEHHKRHSSSGAAPGVASSAADAARRSSSDAGADIPYDPHQRSHYLSHLRAAQASASPQENSYLIGPRAHAAAAGSPAAAQALGLVPFSAAAARRALRAAILERVAAAPCPAYDAPAAAQMAKRLAEDARQRLRALGYGRYKLVVQAVVGERGGAAVRVASRCLWGDGDGWASESYESDALYCVVQVHALYHE